MGDHDTDKHMTDQTPARGIRRAKLEIRAATAIPVSKSKTAPGTPSAAEKRADKNPFQLKPRRIGTDEIGTVTRAPSLHAMPPSNIAVGSLSLPDTTAVVERDMPMGSVEPDVKTKKAIVPDIPLRFNNFADALSSCREDHRLPEELLMDQTAVQRTWLLSQLKKADTVPKLEALAYRLTYKDLALLFSALATLKKREETDQIQSVIRLRASHYLYLCGWVTFQYSYPRSSVAKALSDLCIILEDVSFLKEQMTDWRHVPPVTIPELGGDFIIWSEVPLISEISLPNSRRFISDIATEMFESNLDENQFIKRYAIFPNLSLGRAIFDKYEEISSGMPANPMLSGDFFERFRRNRSLT